MDAETITLPIRPEWRAAVAYLGHPDLRVARRGHRRLPRNRRRPVLPSFAPCVARAELRGDAQHGRPHLHPAPGPRPGRRPVRRLQGLLHLADRSEARQQHVHPLPRPDRPEHRDLEPLARLQAAGRGAGSAPLRLAHHGGGKGPQQPRRGGTVPRHRPPLQIAALPPRLREHRDLLPEDCR